MKEKFFLKYLEDILWTKEWSNMLFNELILGNVKASHWDLEGLIDHPSFEETWIWRPN